MREKKIPNENDVYQIKKDRNLNEQMNARQFISKLIVKLLIRSATSQNILLKSHLWESIKNFAGIETYELRVVAAIRNFATYSNFFIVLVCGWTWRIYNTNRTANERRIIDSCHILVVLLRAFSTNFIYRLFKCLCRCRYHRNKTKWKMTRKNKCGQR